MHYKVYSINRFHLPDGKTVGFQGHTGNSLLKQCLSQNLFSVHVLSITILYLRVVSKLVFLANDLFLWIIFYAKIFTHKGHNSYMLKRCVTNMQTADCRLADLQTCRLADSTYWPFPIHFKNNIV